MDVEPEPMTTRVGARGRVTIPKRLRDRLELSAGQVLHFDIDHGRLVISRDPEDRLESVKGTAPLPEWATSVDDFIDQARGRPTRPT